MFTFNTVPEGLPQWKQTEVARLRGKFCNPADTAEVDGVLRWISNGRPVPGHVFRDAFCAPSEKQLQAGVEDTNQALAEYRAAQANRSPDQISEERNMARAAVGPGHDMINIITGETYRT